MKVPEVKCHVKIKIFIRMQKYLSEEADAASGLVGKYFLASSDLIAKKMR